MFALVAVSCAATWAQATGEESASATPYRPSVSTPAALSAPGYLEFELGGLAARGVGPARRHSLPYTVKLAFDADWGVRLGGEAWVRKISELGRSSSGFGDSSVVLKHRWAVNDRSALGLELGGTFPTRTAQTSSGSASYSLNGIYSGDIEALHADINLTAIRVGGADSGVSRLQTLWAASLSKSLNDPWGLVGELSGTNQRGTAGTSQFLLAATYNVSKSLVLDAGCAHSLRIGIPDASVFIGLTVLGPRLF